MKTSITLYRQQHRCLVRQVQKNSDALLTRRILAVLYLADGQSVSVVARRLAAARSSVGRWRALLQSYGETGLIPGRGGRPVSSMTEPAIVDTLQVSFLETIASPRTHDTAGSISSSGFALGKRSALGTTGTGMT